MTALESVRWHLAQTERAGKFWTRLSGVIEEMAAKWEEFSGEQFDREVEALKCADQAAACRAEWKRWKLRERELLTAFPETKITVKDRLMSNPKPEGAGE